ncbi:pyridoxal phosphate-dependent transferase [Geopyxis carbonaria]|nr:pyridoxal phosphate-dependent transferase [Geopyxis carbonaria]
MASYHHDGRDRRAYCDRPPYYTEKPSEKPAPRNPVDLAKHYNRTTLSRPENPLKNLYRYFFVPGMANLAGGFPPTSYFAFSELGGEFTPAPDAAAVKDTCATRFSLFPKAAVAEQKHSRLSVPLLDGSRAPADRIDLATALQYGRAQGLAPVTAFLKEYTLTHLHQNRIPYDADIIPTVGATDGFHKVVSLIGARGDTMLVEEWMYVNALNTVKPLGIATAAVAIDTYGMVPAALRAVLDGWDAAARGSRKPHFLYTVSAGHNPTGATTPLSRRKALYAICSAHDVLIIEDEPYWHLQFPAAPPPPPSGDGAAFMRSLVPSFLTLDTDGGRVIRLDTLSKTVAPGCRMGWVTAHRDITARLAAAAEASTQQPSGFVQALVGSLLVRHWGMRGWLAWLEKLRALYDARMRAQCAALHAGRFHIASHAADGDCEKVSRTEMLRFAPPAGGMFVWVRVLLHNHPAWAAWAARGHTRGDMLWRLWMFVAETRLSMPCPGQVFASTPQMAQECDLLRFCFSGVEEEEVAPATERWVEGCGAFWELGVEEVEAIGEGEDVVADAGAGAGAGAGASAGMMPWGC